MVLSRQGMLVAAGWLLLVNLCWWIYQPGLQSPPLLDDGVNLSVLQQLEEHPEYLADVVQGNRSGLLGRSVSMLTFAVEKVYFDAGLLGLKKTNLLIHLLIGTLVAMFGYRIFALRGISGAVGYGLTVGACWLMSPLLLSTVLYTVQRMAQMSTLFVLLGLHCFISFRARIIQGKPAVVSGLTVIACAVIAVLAKENGVVILPLMVLMEWFLFEYKAASPLLGRWLKIVFQASVVMGASVVLFILISQPSAIVGAYEVRDFGLDERLLTQLRALCHYIAQLLVPDTLQMGVFQDDFPVSHGWLEPFSTLVSGLVLLCAVGTAWFLRGQRCLGLLGFGLLFFLAAHSLESSFVPLELYFEHRNYLPAIGIYLAVAALAASFIQRFPALLTPVIMCLCVFVMSLAYGTAYQSIVWSNKFLLHFGAVNAHPASPRAMTELAKIYAEEGHIEQSLEVSAEVRRLQSRYILRHDIRDLILHCAAGASPPGKYLSSTEPEVVDLADAQANEVLQLLVRRIIDGQCRVVDAQRLANRMAEVIALEASPLGTRKIYSLMASLENHVQRPGRAMRYTDLLLEKSPDDHKGLLMKLYFSTQLNLPESAASARERLLEMQSRGELSREEQFNLSLFTAQ